MRVDDVVQAWEKFFREVFNSQDEWMMQLERRRTGKFPFFKSKDAEPSILLIKDVRHHEYIPRLLDLELPLRVVHIIRDPRAAMHSWLTNPKEFPKEADPIEQWRNGAVRKVSSSEYWGFDDWKMLTERYRKLAIQYPEKVMLITYEELVNAPIDVTKRTFEQLGLTFTDQTTEFIRSSRSKNSADPFSVFKDPSVQDRWRGALQQQIQMEIEKELMNSDLEVYLRT